MTRLRLLLRRTNRTLLARRRLVAAVCAALTVAVVLQAHQPPAPPRSLVLTAARDLPAGSMLTADDLELVEFAPASAPEGRLSLRQAVGRRAAGPIRSGEPVTDVRVLGPGLLRRFPGMVAAPVRIGDAASVNLIRVGDRVSVLATDPQGTGVATTVADNATVIAIPTRRTADSGLTSGALIVVAVTPETGRRLAGAGVNAFLSVLLVR